MEKSAKFTMFSILVAQAGLALTKEELEVAFNASQQLEGFKEEDFAPFKEENEKRASQLVQSGHKRKHLVESFMFNLLIKEGIEGLYEDENIREKIMKAKFVASMMADEFMEPDEKLEKIIKDGRRLIEVFIEQWKKNPIQESEEIIEPEVVD